MRGKRSDMPRSIDAGENWKPFPPLALYEVSSDGQVRVALNANRKGSRPGHLHKSHWRYTRFVVCLTDGIRRWEEPLADMVAAAHLPAPPCAAAQVYHVDGDPRNCAAANLDWTRPDEAIPPSLLAEGEIARAVEGTGLENYYVTNRGRVWSRKSRAFLAVSVGNGNIMEVNAIRNGKTTHLSVPKLVATAFPEAVGPRPARTAPLAYRDEDYGNCAAENLYWTSHDLVHTARHKRRREALRTTSVSSEGGTSASSESGTSRQADTTAFAPCPDAIRFLLNHYKMLPAHEAIKNRHYYYIDGRFRILCASCATRIVGGQESHLEWVDVQFPIDCRVLWPGRSVTCADCGDTVVCAG